MACKTNNVCSSNYNVYLSNLLCKEAQMKKLILICIMILPGCASIPLIKPKPPCDPSRFNMTSFKGRMAHYWCEVKQCVKKI